MSDEVEIAESAAEAVKGLGLRKYLWLYFFVVPLAAATASIVAIGVAALQGLSDHPSSASIYAGIVIAAAKSIVVVGAGYGTGLLLALLTTYARGLSKKVEKVADEKDSLPSAIRIEIDGLLAGVVPVPRVVINTGLIAAAIRRDENLLLGLAVGYALIVMVGGFALFVWRDVEVVFNALSVLASS